MQLGVDVGPEISKMRSTSSGQVEEVVLMSYLFQFKLI
jgi:hypothetical protein